MNLTKETIEQLRAQHGSIYRGSIAMLDPRTDERVEVAFVYREPTYADAERLAGEVKGSPSVAYRNILSSVIVHPSPGEVMDRLGPFLYAMMRFVDQKLMPFFGESAEVASQRL